jgi:hypothetical protein
MKNTSNLRDIVPTFANQKNYLSNILDANDFDKLVELKDELKDTWTKKQIFRTETEMRVSVLNDAKFPTRAAKYWQCIREQNAFFETTMQLSFEYRKNEVEIKKLERAIDQEIDELEKELLQIELEQKLYGRSNMELVAKDRIRELDLWSKLKAELDDGSFDTQNVNTHQKESLMLALENRAKMISPGAGPAEVMNIIGPLKTAQRLAKENPQQNLLTAETSQTFSGNFLSDLNKSKQSIEK